MFQLKTSKWQWFLKVKTTRMLGVLSFGNLQSDLWLNIFRWVDTRQTVTAAVVWIEDVNCDWRIIFGWCHREIPIWPIVVPSSNIGEKSMWDASRAPSDWQHSSVIQIQRSNETTNYLWLYIICRRKVAMWKTSNINAKTSVVIDA